MLDAVRHVERLAGTLGDDASAILADELAEQLLSDDLNALVVGQFKRGKSSLINALLGADVMPTGALPLTGLVTAIRYGDEPLVEVQLAQEDGPKRIPVEELPLYVTERHNPANKLGVERTEVRWPAPRIRGLTLFDTPGVGSIYRHNSETAKAALPRADMAILVVGPDPPLGAEEAAYAHEVVASSEQLFVVLNKADLAGDALPEVLAFTRDAIGQQIAGGCEIFPLSATEARTAQLAGGEAQAFSAFVERLRNFVDVHGAQTRARSAQRRTLALVHRLDVLVSMRRATLALPRNERERRWQALESALQIVDDRVRSLELVVDDDVRQLAARLEEDLDRLHDRDVTPLLELAGELAKERSSERRSQRVEELIADRVRAWRAEMLGHADVALHAYTAKYGRLIGEIERSVIEAGCRALHVDPGDLTPRDIAFAPAQLALVASVMPTTGLEILLATAVSAFPRPLREAMLRRRYAQVLETELGALHGKLRYGIGRDLEPWRRSVRATISTSVAQTRALVTQAFDEFGSGDATERDRELTHLDSLASELQALRRALLVAEAV